MRRPAAGWAAAYLVAAGALIAVAGAELSGPSPERRARELERRTARELAAAVETARAVATSHVEENRRCASEREAALDAAFAATCSWARSLDGLPEHADLRGDFSRAAADLAPLLPEGVAVAVLAPSGERIFEAGGVVDLDSPRTLIAPADEALTVAVAWVEDAAPAGRTSRRCGPTSAAEWLAETLRGELAASFEPGTGLYFVADDGSVVAVVFPRPMPAMPAGAPVGTRLEGVAKSVTGDRETGRLVSARRALTCSASGVVVRSDDSPKLTAVAERFLSPEALTGGSAGLAGMFALAGLGVVAAAAFAHALRTVFVGGPSDANAARAHGAAGAPPRAIPGGVTGPAGQTPAGRASGRYGLAPAAEVLGAESGGAPPWRLSPPGRSIPRLRESLGASGEGPDLAACARSPILRALSRCVRHPTPAFVPREVKEWAKQAFGERPGGPVGSMALSGRRGPVGSTTLSACLPVRHRQGRRGGQKAA